MSAFKISGYIISILDDRRICLRLDKHLIESVSDRLSIYMDKNTFKDTLVVNVRDCRFAIDTQWKELSDLVSTHVTITVVPRKYSYWKYKDIVDENDQHRFITVRHRGVSLLAKKIANSQ